jgi:hypothetical protein
VPTCGDPAHSLKDYLAQDRSHCEECGLHKNAGCTKNNDGAEGWTVVNKDMAPAETVHAWRNTLAEARVWPRIRQTHDYYVKNKGLDYTGIRAAAKVECPGASN